MKKKILSLLVICSILSMTISPSHVNAVDFKGNEDKYIKLCTSSSLTNSNKKVCQDFNQYLSQKNRNLNKKIDETRNELQETLDDIESISSHMKAVDAKISDKQEEINYLYISIEKIEKEIKVKEDLMKERLYTMQPSYNSNFFLDFLFGAKDFTDFFARLTGINDITSYEKELVEELTTQKQELATQKATLQDALEALKVEKKEQETLQKKLLDLKLKQEKQIKESENEAEKALENQKRIDTALSQLISQAPSGGGGSYVAGDSKIGNAIAQAALSKLGSRYWWGKAGPDYFDCSGLVCWAHNQAGVKLGRTSAAGYASSGQPLTRNQLQPGDVITFSYGGGVAHIGIYIGGGNFVHAAGDGSSTVGQYANQCVKAAKLSGYWQSYVYNYRRLY